ncbi:serine hydrolase domain-containing protein [Algoriphagus zhangzhouensis]|uniref:CubicO group peptidase, beta-lactamase class C family n=1 Tax=Algoriphagus zhangzhouensis TaxID=1073327 RepID=A0A1M7ZCQ6_9BACT|nr:serine hydrolase [Algoriphagus zhangzhouensis]TDY45651.1 CubicO group peptidase (beta-lactamase class C family) [Algoriphagus zhangzhouensis]SHO62695.1 CubicO group peptidase, beta-lactamase class C family [Algoriphagus zhangzhouensis]
MNKAASFLKALIFIGAFFSSFHLSAQGSSSGNSIYFPPNDSQEWEKMSQSEAGFDQQKMGEFLSWLSETDTRGFLILKDGKIVVEEYWGGKLTGLGPMDPESFWYWASAGKTLTAAMIGIAENEKLLKIKDKTQKYLGNGWTSMSAKEEKKIRIVHHLTMTTGIDNDVMNLDDTSPSSFKFLTKPGTRWSYHNGTYTVLEKLLEKASGETYQSYFKSRIGDKIGMKGFWQKAGQNNVFYSSPRSMARFGILLLSKGRWNGEQIWEGSFFDQMVKSSQNLNPSYGYLTWLNGQKSFMLPGVEKSLSGSLIQNGPIDMYQAMGKNGQFLMVVPSENLVVVRMGGASDSTTIPFLLIRQMWDKLAPVIQP